MYRHTYIRQRFFHGKMTRLHENSKQSNHDFLVRGYFLGNPNILVLQVISYTCNRSNFFLSQETEFLCLISSFLCGDSYHAYNFVRELVVKHVRNRRVWNLFNVVIMRADDVRHNRFLMRLMGRNPDNVALSILNGHNCLVAGTYKVRVHTIYINGPL